jgi:hypothetical protein
MCVIAYVEEQKNMPSLEMLEDMEQANPDGGGYACLTESGEVLWRKNVTAKNIHDAILEGRIQAPAAFHFRIATSGGIKPGLCHPFPLSRKISTALSGTARSVLFHNGHWHQGELLVDMMESRETKLNGPWSDSRAMAVVIHRGLMSPETIAETAGKLLVFNKDAQLRYGFWEQRDGVYVSNTYWEYSNYGCVVSPRIGGTKYDTHRPGQWTKNKYGDTWSYQYDNSEPEKTDHEPIHWAENGFACEADYLDWLDFVRDRRVLTDGTEVPNNDHQDDGETFWDLPGNERYSG